MGPPVARSAANPWAPGFENLKGTSPARVGPTAVRFLSKLVSSKSLRPRKVDSVLAVGVSSSKPNNPRKSQ